MSHHRARFGFTVLLAAVALNACAGPTEPGQQNNNNNKGKNQPAAAGLNLTNFNPARPSPEFVRAASQAEWDQLAQDMWSTLTAPACWDATSVLPVGHVSQFQFYNQNEYRHFGFSTNWGAILVHALGRYQGKPMAIVETWTGEVEAILIVDSSRIAHVFPHIGGQTMTVLQYGASNGPCL